MAAHDADAVVAQLVHGQRLRAAADRVGDLAGEVLLVAEPLEQRDAVVVVARGHAQSALVLQHGLAVRR